MHQFYNNRTTTALSRPPREHTCRFTHPCVISPKVLWMLMRWASDGFEVLLVFHRNWFHMSGGPNCVSRFPNQIKQRKKGKEGEKRKPVVALILFNKSAHGDKYRKIICSRFLPAKFDFRLVCNVGLHGPSCSEHLHHVAETSAQELPTSACVSDSRFTARSLCLPRNKCHKSTKKSTHAPQKAVSIRVHLHDSVFAFHPLWLRTAFKRSGDSARPVQALYEHTNHRRTFIRSWGKKKKCFPYVSTPQTHFFF